VPKNAQTKAAFWEKYVFYLLIYDKGATFARYVCA
jgi:hypothetical protein